jgi:hypothetical protein
MKPYISPSELLALTAMSDELAAVKKPSLGLRYRFFGGVGASFGIVIASIAVFNPVLFIAELVSPSIIPIDQLIATLRIRGIFTIFLILLWLLSHKNTKYTLALVVGMFFWTTTITAINLYQLFELQVFTATGASAIYLTLRPLIFVSLVIIAKDLRVYLKAMDFYNRSKSAAAK